ncbi:uncharacterized protein [Nicotiana tomentosiformis]|uniref:uncharacterized protein isoform X4 n=1 Tax=Nicotiana tomentosiformis TaxID=4098 RepID=UPI00388C3A51
MDFDNMKRKELQALCKKHGIPANLTNLEMVNKLSSIIKVNDEKLLTQGRSCLKVFDETVNDRESDVVNRTLKKVKFSPENEIFEFTKSVEVKSRGRRKSMLHNNSLSVRSDGVKIGILGSPVRVTRSRGMNLEDGVSEKKGRTRRTKDSVLLVNESEDEVGMTKRRSLRNKEVVPVQERREENEGENEGLRMSRRVKGEKIANKSPEELDKSTSEKEIDPEKRDKKVTFSSDDQIMECMKAETKAKEMKRGGRRKSIAHTQTSHVQNEVDAKVRDEVLEKPAERITRSRNLKSVEDYVGNKRNRTRGKEVIERNEKLLCTEFVESSVEAANNEVKVTTRRSQQNNVVEEASQTALKRSKRQATKAEGARFTVEAANDEVKATTRSQQNMVVEEAPQTALTRSKRLASKAEGARLTDDISKDKMVTRDRTRNQSNLAVEASTSDVVPQLDKQVEVPLRRSDRRESVFPLEKLRSDEAVAVKEKRNLNVNDDEMANKGQKDEPLRALKRSKRLATQVEDSVLAKDDIAENKVVDRGMTTRNQSNLKRNVSSVETRCKMDRPTESQGTVEVVITLEEPGEAPVKRSNRHKSVVPSLEKLRTDEVAAAKEKRNLDANDDKVRGKSTKEEPQKALKRSKGLAQQVKDSLPAKDDIAENKAEERRRSGRNAAKDNVDTKLLDGSVQEEIVVVKEERRRSERSASKAYADTKILDSSVQEEIAVVNEEKRRSERSAAKASVVTKILSSSVQEERRRSERSAAKANVDTKILDSSVQEERRASERSAAKASVITKILDSSVQEEIAVVKEERRRSERSAAKTNVITETLDSSAQEEIPVVKEERRSSGRSVASLTLVTVSDEKKESGENKLTKRNCTAVPEKSSTKNKFALQDLDSLKQSTSRAKTNVEAAAVVEKTSTSEDMEIVRESDSKDCDISGSEGATSFSKSGLNELEAVKNDVNIVLAGSKDEAVADSSTLAENLKEKGPLGDANASPSENNSTFKCPPFSDPFSSNARPDENVVEELLQSDHEAPASLCPSSVLADDAFPNDITSDKQEHGAIAADDAEEFDIELSNEVIDNSSLHHSDKMEENLESGLKEQSETGCIVDEGVTYGEQEPACNLADDAVPNDLTLDKKELGATASDNADEFDTGLSNEVLDNYSLNQSDNMKDNLESGFKKQSETGFIVTEGVTSGEQELTVTDYAREFDAGLSSSVSLDSVGAFNLSNEMEVKNSESGPMEKAEAGCIAKCDGDAPTFTTQGELHAEGFANLEETTKEFSSISQPDDDAAGLSSAFTFEKSCDHGKQSTFRPRNCLDCSIQTSSELAKYNEGEYLDDQVNEPDEGVRSIEFEATEGQEEIIDDEQQLRNSNDNEGGYLEDQDNGPDEGVRSIEFEATEGQEDIIDDEQLRNSNDNGDGYLEDQYNEPDQGMQQQLGHNNDSEGSVEAAASEKTVSSPIKAVLDFQEPAVLGDDIALEDSDEEKQGEELKVLFATPCDVSYSKEESKASLEGDSRLKENKVTLDKEVKNREFDENLNRKGQASVSGNDNLSLQNSVRDCDEHGQGEILKSLFAIPFGGRSSKVEIATSIELNETSSQYKHSCHANEKTFPSAGNGLSQSTTPLKDTSKDEEAGEELKSLFATPLFVSRSIGGEPYHFRSQLSGEAMILGEGLGSSGKRNPSEPVGGLIADEQEMSIVTEEHLNNLSASPISVKSTNEETTSTKGKYCQSHEMETFSCSGLESNVGECEDGPAGVNQAPVTSHVAAFNYGDESEQEDQLNMLFTLPINTQTLNQMDGTSSKTEELSAQGLSHHTGLSVANPSVVDLSESDSIDSKQSEDNITVEYIKETPECIKGSSSLEEENNEGQGNMLSATSAKSTTPLRKDELSSQEPKTADVAMSGEMVRDQEMNTRPESWVQEIVDGEEHGTDETVADRDLLLRDTSKALEEDVDVEILNQNSEPTFNDAEFSEQQLLEINKSSPESIKPSDDVYDEENTEDHLKLLFATPIKGTSTSRLSEASTCQLKTTTIAIASEMVGKEPKCKGFEFSGEPLTVEIIDGSCESRKGSCLLKENEEQFKRGPLFATPSKSASPLQLEESLSCQLDTAEFALSTKGIDSKAGDKSQGCPLGTMEAKESCEPSKDSEALEHIKSSLQEPEIEEAVAGKDLLLIYTSEYLEENIYSEIANKNTSAVISEPACDELEFSEQQMVLETHKSSPESIKQSDAVNEENSEDHLKLLFATPNKETSPSGTESIQPYDAINEENNEDHLKLLFATPIKGTSPSKLDEDSTCQLKTAMIATASEMIGKEPKRKGSEFSGEPLTVEIISGGSSSTKGSCLFKENEQFKEGPLFATPSKGISPLQLEECPCCEEDIFKDMDGGKFLSSQEQSFAQYEDRQLLNEMIDDTGEATLKWFQTNDGSVPRETQLETQKENDSVLQFESLHEKGEVTEDDALAEGQAHDRQMTSQESPENEVAKGGSVTDAVCQQPNMLLSDIETESITQESITKTNGTSISAESGILDFDAESTTLRSQEKIIITLEETRGDEEQNLEVRNTSNSFQYNIPNNDEDAKEISIVLPADKQFHFPEHNVIENVASTRELAASTNECQYVFKEVDLAAQRDSLTVFESNESTSMNVNDSVLTTQMDLPGIFAGVSGKNSHSALSEEPQSESDQGKSCKANQQDEYSFDKKEHEITESVVSPSYKSRGNINFIEEGFAGEDTLMSEKKNSLAEKKGPFIPAGVAKTSLAEHLNSTVKKKNVRTILIHGTPNKQSQKADMKENDPNVKGNIGTLTALRSEKRRALQILPWK